MRVSLRLLSAIILIPALTYGCSSQTAPSGLSLTATPASIVQGASSTLTWNAITGATSCTIDNGIGVVACSAGSKAVTPATTTTYTLTATGTGGSNTSTATVTVTSGTPSATPTPVGGITPVTPTRGTFTAAPTTVAAGGAVTLSWAGVFNADHCIIDNNVGLVPCSDSSIVVHPTVTTAYTFSAIGVGTFDTCGITKAGPVYCWGDNLPQPTQIGPTGGYTEISAGGSQFCARSPAGDLACWGSSGILPPSEPVSFLAIGGTHACAGLTSSGKVVCWGEGGEDRMGGNELGDQGIEVVGQP